MRLDPSRYRRLLHLILAALMLRALFQLPLPVPAVLISFALACSVARFMYRRETGVQQLLHDGQGRWSWRDQGYWHRGMTASGCYRSRLLVVLAISGDDGRRRHLCVWRDSVSAAEFSYLQLYLLLIRRETLASRLSTG